MHHSGYIFYNMYTYDQLQEMGDEQLQELAKSLGIKRVDAFEHDALVYQLLDHQADTAAANAALSAQCPAG